MHVEWTQANVKFQSGVKFCLRKKGILLKKQNLAFIKFIRDICDNDSTADYDIKTTIVCTDKMQQQYIKFKKKSVWWIRLFFYSKI